MNFKKLKSKMCGNKLSFRTKEAAQRTADKFGQSVYECPICFCYHCTSKKDWRQEYISIDEYNRLLNKYEKCLKEIKTYENKLNNINVYIKKQLTFKKIMRHLRKLKYFKIEVLCNNGKIVLGNKEIPCQSVAGAVKKIKEFYEF